MSNYIRNAVGSVFLASTFMSNTPQKPISQTEIRQMKVLSDLTENDSAFNKNTNGRWEKWDYKREASIQRTIDSLAYKQILNTTPLANDSTVVKEFNEISKKMTPHPRHALATYIQNDYKDHLLSMGCSEKEANKLRADCMTVYPVSEWGEMHFTKEGDINSVARHQYLTDSVAYNRFFSAKGLLDSSVKNKITQIAKKIKP